MITFACSGRRRLYRFDGEPNWVDDGALSLGIASYAIVSGDAALVYDTHVAVEERVLLAGLGEPYQRFAESRKRLIPGVW